MAPGDWAALAVPQYARPWNRKERGAAARRDWAPLTVLTVCVREAKSDELRAQGTKGMGLPGGTNTHLEQEPKDRVTGHKRGAGRPVVADLSQEEDKDHGLTSP